MKKWEKYTKEELSKIVKESYSYREVAKKIGYQENGGTGQAEVKKMIEKYAFDVSHFTGQGWSKNKVNTEKYQYGIALKHGQALRDLTILRGHQCEECGLTEWNQQSIPLEVHHLDGDHLNSEMGNLKLLCPNCHALTENYRSKNIRKEVSEKVLVEALKTTPNVRQALMKVGLTGKGKNYDRCYNLIHKFNIVQEDDINKPTLTEAWVRSRKEQEVKLCKKCGKPLSSNRSEICQLCAHENQRRCEWPTREELKQKIRTSSFLQIGKEYGVSDNAVRKWCKYYNLPFKAKEIKKYTDEEWENI